MPLSYPKRKGFLYSFQSLQVLDGADQLKGIMGFKANPKVDGKKLVFGNGRKAYGRTRGQLTVECEITFLAEAFFDWLATHKQFIDEEFDFTAVCEEGSRRDKIEVIGLSFDSSEMPFEGTDEIKVTIPGMAIDLKINGESPVEGDSLGLEDDAGAA